MIMYKKLRSSMTGEVISILRLNDNAQIPFDPDNTDFVEYLKWLELGNTPLPAENT